MTEDDINELQNARLMPNNNVVKDDKNKNKNSKDSGKDKDKDKDRHWERLEFMWNF